MRKEGTDDVRAPGVQPNPGRWAALSCGRVMAGRDGDEAGMSRGREGAGWGSGGNVSKQAQRIRKTPSGKRRGGPFSNQMGSQIGCGMNRRGWGSKSPLGKCGRLFRVRLEGGGPGIQPSCRPSGWGTGPSGARLGLRSPLTGCFGPLKPCLSFAPLCGSQPSQILGCGGQKSPEGQQQTPPVLFLPRGQSHLCGPFGAS